jgi:hypothetical protein
MEVAEVGFAGVEDSTPEAALGSAADAATADIVAATMEVAARMAGAEDIGAEDTVTAGELALGGRIGVGDGGIRMATTTARAITRLILIITHTTVLRTIPRAIRTLRTATTILHRQIPTHGHSPTRTDLQDPGDPRYREAERMQTTETATSRPLRRVGRLSPLTG